MKFVILFFLICTSSYAEDLKSYLSSLDIISVNYGDTDVLINNTEVKITRGLHQTGTAGNSDAFITMVRKNDKVWEFVPLENKEHEAFIAWQAPHTYEDSLSSVHFLKDKKNKKLYMLYAKRKLEGSFIKASSAEFTFYSLEESKDLDSFFFKKVHIAETKATYCNIDWALFKELGIAPPKDGNEYDCKKLIEK